MFLCGSSSWREIYLNCISLFKEIFGSSPTYYFLLFFWFVWFHLDSASASERESDERVEFYEIFVVIYFFPCTFFRSRDILTCRLFYVCTIVFWEPCSPTCIISIITTLRGIGISSPADSFTFTWCLTRNKNTHTQFLLNSFFTHDISLFDFNLNAKRDGSTYLERD